MRAIGGILVAVCVLTAVQARALEGKILNLDYNTDSVKVIDASSGTSTTVATGVDSIRPCFSPDGTQIAYVASGNLTIANADGSSPQVVKSGFDTSGSLGLNWAVDGHIYYGKITSSDLPIRKVNISNGNISTAYTTADACFRWGSTSIIGGRAAYDYTSGVYGAEFGVGEHRISNPCYGQISPDGTLVTSYAEGHNFVTVYDFETGWEYARFAVPNDAYAWEIQFAHGSNDFICVETTKSGTTWLYLLDIRDGTWNEITADGLLWDYHPNPGSVTGLPVLDIDASQAPDFAANVGGPNPIPQRLAVGNSGNGRLRTLQVSDDAGWLTVSVDGYYNMQSLVHDVDVSGLSSGTYTANVTVSCPNTQADATYSVTLEVASNPLAIVPEPQMLSFVVEPGGSNPTSQTVDVAAAGGTLSDVTITESAAWLTVTRSGSGNSQVLTNSVDASKVPAGRHQTTVQVSGGGAANTATYTVEVIAEPALGLTPDRVYFTGVAGGTQPSDQTVTINNVGAGTFTTVSYAGYDWVAFTCRVPDGVDWLDSSMPMILESGQDPNVQPFTVKLLDWASVTAGTYTTEMFVGGGGAAEGVVLPVTLYVTPSAQPVMQVTPEELSFSGTAGGTAPSDQTVDVANIGDGTLDAVSVSESASWLDVSVGGSGNAQQLTNSVDLSGLSMGYHEATVTVSSGNAFNDADYTVTVYVSPGTSTNAPPTISDIANQTIDEDQDTGAISFTVDDTDDDPASLSLSATSSNESLVPVSGVEFGGSGTSRTVRVTPVTNGNGTADITVTVSDGSASAQDVFRVTVNAVNDAPTISNISNRTIDEDTSTGSISFTVNDVDGDPLTLQKGSSNTTLLPTSAISLGGSGSSRTVTCTPAANEHGTATVTITVSDGSATDQDSFVLTVSPVNDAPTISSIANQTINEDGNTGALAFTVGDVDGDTLTVNRASDNTTLIPLSGIVVSGSGANRTVTVTPATDRNGSATVTLSVTDGTATAQEAFDVTVNSVNDAPTISNIANQSIDEDGNTGAISFTIDDVDDAATSLNLSGTSDNTTLVPEANIVFGGSGTSRTVTVTPAANQHGTATITVDVSDGALNAQDSFTMTVNAVNDAPVAADDSASTAYETSVLISVLANDSDVDGDTLSIDTFETSTSNGTISQEGDQLRYTPDTGFSGSDTFSYTVTDGSLTDTAWVTVNVGTPSNTAPTISTIGNQSTNEDTPRNGIAFTVGDAESAASALTVTAWSSDQTLLPDGNISINGSDANRTLDLAPATNKSGSATVTVRVSDGSLTDETSFTLTVNAVNDAPTISSIADQTVAENTGTGAIGFTVGDVDNTASSLTLSASSSNQTLAPNGNITLAGTGTSRTVSVTPADQESGTTTITVTVSDGTDTASTSFTLTVTSVADSPTIGSIADQSVDEDGATGAIGFTISDPDTALSALSVTAWAADTTLVPGGNITLGGSGGNRTIDIAPDANQHGSTTITVRVSDGNTHDETTFMLTVNPINDVPTISSIANQSVAANDSTTVGFVIGDVETDAASLTVTAVSDNTTLLPASGISLGGSGTNRSVTLTPATDETGTANVTVTVNDGGLTAETTFQLTVSLTLIPTTVTVAPSLVQITPNETADFAATVLDQNGDQMTATVDWTISGGGSLTSATGTNTTFISDGSTGSFTITATSGTASGSATIEVDPAYAPSITITSPSAGTWWAPGSTQTIQWTAFRVRNVTIQISTDDQASWTVLDWSILDTDADWGSYTFTVPDAITDTCYIRIDEYYKTTDDVAGPVRITHEKQPGASVNDGNAILGSEACGRAPNGHTPWGWLIPLMFLLLVRVTWRRRREVLVRR